MLEADAVCCREGEFPPAPVAVEDDGFGPTRFDASALAGLGLSEEPELLRRVAGGNAAELLGLVL